MKRLREFWEWLKNAAFEPNSSTLLRQYWRTLQARLSQFEARTSYQNDTLKRLKDLLSGSRNWDSAYSADLLVPQLLEGHEIDVEFASRMEEAHFEWPKGTADLQKAYSDRWSLCNSEVEKRALLQEVVHQGLWQFAILDQERRYRSKAILLSTVLFVWSLGFLFVSFGAVDNQLFDLQSWSGSCWMVALAGWSGASFSWLTRMRDTVREKNLDVLKDISRWHYCFSRAFIGAGASVVLFLALRGGFISGAVFPVLDITQSQERMTKVSQAFRALASTASLCSPGQPEKDRDAVLASSVENFRALVVVFVRERKGSAGKANGYLSRPDFLDYDDRDWLVRAGLRPDEQKPAGNLPGSGHSLTLCNEGPFGRDSWTIRNALLAQPGTLALLLFWSFVAGFSEKLVPSILDGAGEKVSSSKVT